MASEHASERTASLLRAAGLPDEEIIAALVEKLGLTADQAAGALRAVAERLGADGPPAARPSG